ncbi:MAG: hypothetical protein H7A32_06240 [Deltaproteobacteria bacterium]|nr:hypothetical protein [Deltaproteobacteria bacterium]
MIDPDILAKPTNSGTHSLMKTGVFLIGMCLLNGGVGTGEVYAQTGPSLFDDYDLKIEGSTSCGSYYVQSYQSNSSKLFEFRRLSGLTWEKIAKIFGVSRRSVHFWANGKAMEDIRVEKLNRLLEVIKKIDTGSSRQNRYALFAVGEKGVSLFDRLKEGDFDVSKLKGSVSKIQYRRYSSQALSGQGRKEVEFYPPVSPLDMLEVDYRSLPEKPAKVSIAKVKKIKSIT